VAPPAAAATLRERCAAAGQPIWDIGEVKEELGITIA
jgi:hypothetical protein